MECFHCQGQMRYDVAPFHVDRNGYHVYWQAIPAWVCDQCGEPLFEAAEVDKIQAALLVLDSTVKPIPQEQLEQYVA